MQNACKNSIAGKGGSAVMIDAVLLVRKVMLVVNAMVRIVMLVMVANALLIDGNVVMQ